MNRIRRLLNPVQEYAWGSRSAIAKLLGQPVPSPRPQAELWMGAHPRAPSHVLLDGGEVRLDEWIQKDPVTVLGPRTAVGFDRQLPFLLKVLAAGLPLSIQAHPDREQAREGFAREEEAGIPRDAPERNYRDDNHKPELICALTRFWALNGFRATDEIARLVERLDVVDLEAIVSDDLAGTLSTLLGMQPAMRRTLVGQVVDSARRLATEDPAYDWIGRLQMEYPDDAGVLGPLLLNLVRLEPGQAMALPARRLHAYLDGTGIEIMANSDNVLRGGLTVKHVDVPELLTVLEFEPSDPGVMAAEPVSRTESLYPGQAREFALSSIHVSGRDVFSSPEEREVEILLCTEGSGRLDEMRTGYWLEVSRGDSFLVPAAAGPYSIQGRATLFRARVPTA
jgi:mannose-6-phosphate isomerase